jgi:hypothetical protein
MYSYTLKFITHIRQGSSCSELVILKRREVVEVEVKEQEEYFRHGQGAIRRCLSVQRRKGWMDLEELHSILR